MKHPLLTEKSKKNITILLLIVFLLFSGLLAWLIGKPMIHFASNPEQFRAWVDGHGLWGRVVFIGMMVVQVVVAAIPGEPLELGAGYAFGALEGTLLCTLGTTLGCMLVFFGVRKFGVKLVEVFFSREKINSLKFLQNTEKLNFLTFLIFFIPGTPKDLLTYFVGLTNISPFTFLWIVFVARLPSIVTSTISGSALGERNYMTAIIVFGLTAVISGIGILFYRILCKRHNRQDAKHEALARYTVAAEAASRRAENISANHADKDI